MATQPSGKAVPDPPSYLHTAEVADILHVSPKTVTRCCVTAHVTAACVAVVPPRRVGRAPQQLGGWLPEH